MNRQFVVIILGIVLLVVLVPWEKISFGGIGNDDRQATIDSLEAEVEEAKMLYMGRITRLNELSDSLAALQIIVERSNANYNKLKRQNEKLKQERAAIISAFTDDEIQRYLSDRYGKQN